MLKSGNKSIQAAITITLCTVVGTIVTLPLIYNSISIILLAVVTIFAVRGKLHLRSFLQPLNLVYTLYFLIAVAALLTTANFSVEVKNIETKLGIILLPFLFFHLAPFKGNVLYNVLFFLVCIIMLTSLYCLLNGWVYYMQTGDNTHFFYHELLIPINHHAIFYSVFVYIALLFLVLEKGFWRQTGFLNIFRWIATVWMFVLLYLLSSKMILAVAILFFTAYYIRNTRWKKYWWVLPATFAAFVITLFVSKNKVSDRFSEITDSNFALIQKEEIGPEVYLNGLEFRLLQWRNTYEILNKYDAWGIGLSYAGVKPALHEQYDKLRLYKGKVNGMDEGYYQYDTHNQFLQTILQYGIVGLLVLISMYAGLFVIAIRHNNSLLLGLAIVFFCLSFSDTVLERQYGIILFVFFPFMLHYLKIDRKTA